MSMKRQTTWPTFDAEVLEERARLFILACRAGEIAPSIYVTLARAVAALDRALARLRRAREAAPPVEPSPPPKPRPAPKPRRARGRDRCGDST